MKVNPNTPNFQPIQLNITLETEAEAKAMFALFNHADCCGFQKKYGIDSASVRDAIGEKFGDSDFVLDFVSFLRYCN